MQKWPKWALLAYSIRAHSNSICEHLVSPFMAMRLFLQVHINFCAHLHTHLIPTHMPLQLQLTEQVKSWANFNHNKLCRVVKKKNLWETFIFFFLATPFQEEIVSLVNLQPLPSWFRFWMQNNRHECHWTFGALRVQGSSIQVRVSVAKCFIAQIWSLL